MYGLLQSHLIQPHATVFVSLYGDLPFAVEQIFPCCSQIETSLTDIAIKLCHHSSPKVSYVTEFSIVRM